MVAGFDSSLIAPARIIPILVDTFGIDEPAVGLSITVCFPSRGVARIPGLLVNR